MAHEGRRDERTGTEEKRGRGGGLGAFTLQGTVLACRAETGERPEATTDAPRE